MHRSAMLVLVGLFASAGLLKATPHFYRATSVKGATAYQDDTDKSQFYYIPTLSESLLDDRLKTFKATYYGIGDAFFVKDTSTGRIINAAGGIVSGTVSVGISDATRARLLKQIETDFKVKNAKLKAIPLSNVKVQSLILDTGLSIGRIGQAITANPQFEQEFGFSVGATDSLFAQMLASTNQNSSGVKANPHFLMSFGGETEFVGDPWKVKVHCDLSKVWDQVRSSVSVSASLGWFQLGEATYNNINQDLKDSGACTYTEQPGSLFDKDKNLLPILEMTRKIFERLNQEASESQVFKFEPNPEAPAVSAGSTKAVWPWSVSVNGGYSSAHFSQSKTWDTVVEIGTRFLYPITATTVLAVSCNNTTASFFQDLADSTENCITQAKANKLQIRLATEKECYRHKISITGIRLEVWQDYT